MKLNKEEKEILAAYKKGLIKICIAAEVVC